MLHFLQATKLIAVSLLAAVFLAACVTEYGDLSDEEIARLVDLEITPGDRQNTLSYETHPQLTYEIYRGRDWRSLSDFVQADGVVGNNLGITFVATVTSASTNYVDNDSDTGLANGVTYCYVLEITSTDEEASGDTAYSGIECRAAIASQAPEAYPIYASHFSEGANPLNGIFFQEGLANSFSSQSTYLITYGSSVNLYHTDKIGLNAEVPVYFDPEAGMVEVNLYTSMAAYPECDYVENISCTTSSPSTALVFRSVIASKLSRFDILNNSNLQQSSFNLYANPFQERLPLFSQAVFSNSFGTSTSNQYPLERFAISRLKVVDDPQSSSPQFSYFFTPSEDLGWKEWDTASPLSSAASSISRPGTVFLRLVKNSSIGSNSLDTYDTTPFLVGADFTPSLEIPSNASNANLTVGSSYSVLMVSQFTTQDFLVSTLSEFVHNEDLPEQPWIFFGSPSQEATLVVSFPEDPPYQGDYAITIATTDLIDGNGLPCFYAGLTSCPATPQQTVDGLPGSEAPFVINASPSLDIANEDFVCALPTFFNEQGQPINEFYPRCIEKFSIQATVLSPTASATQIQVTWPSQLGDDVGEFYQIYYGTNFDEVDAATSPSTSTTSGDSYSTTNGGNLRVDVPLLSRGTTNYIKVVAATILYPDTDYEYTGYIVSKIVPVFVESIFIETFLGYSLPDPIPLFAGLNDYKESSFIDRSVRPILSSSPTYRIFQQASQNWDFTYNAFQDLTQISSTDLAERTDNFIWNQTSVTPFSPSDGSFEFRLSARNTDNTVDPVSPVEATRETIERHNIFVSSTADTILVIIPDSMGIFTTEASHKIDNARISIFVTPVINTNRGDIDTTATLDAAYNPGVSRNRFEITQWNDGDVSTRGIEEDIPYTIKSVVSATINGSPYYDVSEVAYATPRVNTNPISLYASPQPYFDAPGYAPSNGVTLLVDLGYEDTGVDFFLTVSEERLLEDGIPCEYAQLDRCPVAANERFTSSLIQGSRPMSLQVAGSGVIDYSQATTISLIATAFDDQFTRILNNSLEGYMTRFPIESAEMNAERNALVVTWATPQFPAGSFTTGSTYYTIYYGENESEVLAATSPSISVTSGATGGQFPVVDATRYYIKVVAEARNVTDSATYYLHSEVVERIADVSTLEYEEPLPLFAGYSDYLESNMTARTANVILSSTPTIGTFIGDVTTWNFTFYATQQIGEVRSSAAAIHLTIASDASSLGDNLIWTPTSPETQTTPFQPSDGRFFYTLNATRGTAIDVPSSLESLERFGLFATGGDDSISIKLSNRAGEFTTNETYMIKEASLLVFIGSSEPFDNSSTSATAITISIPTTDTYTIDVQNDGSTALANDTEYFLKAVIRSTINGTPYYDVSVVKTATPTDTSTTSGTEPPLIFLGSPSFVPTDDATIIVAFDATPTNSGSYVFTVSTTELIDEQGLDCQRTNPTGTIDIDSCPATPQFTIPDTDPATPIAGVIPGGTFLETDTHICTLHTHFDSNGNLQNHGANGCMEKFPIKIQQIGASLFGTLSWDSQLDPSTGEEYLIYGGTTLEVAQLAADENKIFHTTSGSTFSTTNGELSLVVPLIGGVTNFFKVVAATRLYPSEPSYAATAYVVSRIVSLFVDPIELDFEEPLPLFVGYSDYREALFSSQNLFAQLSTTPTYDLFQQADSNWDFTYSASALSSNTQASTHLSKTPPIEPNYIWTDNRYTPYQTGDGFVYSLSATRNTGNAAIGSSEETLERFSLFASAGNESISIKLSARAGEFTTNETYMIKEASLLVFISPTTTTPIDDSAAATEINISIPTTNTYSFSFRDSGNATPLSNAASYFVKAVVRTEINGATYYDVSEVRSATPTSVNTTSGTEPPLIFLGSPNFVPSAESTLLLAFDGVPTNSGQYVLTLSPTELIDEQGLDCQRTNPTGTIDIDSCPATPQFTIPDTDPATPIAGIIPADAFTGNHLCAIHTHFDGASVQNHGANGCMEIFPLTLPSTGRIGNQYFATLEWPSQLDPDLTETYQVFTGTGDTGESAAQQATIEVPNVVSDRVFSTNNGTLRVQVPITANTTNFFKVVAATTLYPGEAYEQQAYLVSTIVSTFVTSSIPDLDVPDQLPLFVGYNDFRESAFNSNTASPILSASPSFVPFALNGWDFTYTASPLFAGGTITEEDLLYNTSSPEANFIWDAEAAHPTADGGAVVYTLAASNGTNNPAIIYSSTETLRRHPLFVSAGPTGFYVVISEEMGEFTTDATAAQELARSLTFYNSTNSSESLLQNYTIQPNNQTFETIGGDTQINQGTEYKIKAVVRSSINGATYYDVSQVVSATPVADGAAGSINSATAPRIYYDAPGYTIGQSSTLLVDLGANVDTTNNTDYVFTIGSTEMKDSLGLPCQYSLLEDCLASVTYASTQPGTPQPFVVTSVPYATIKHDTDSVGVFPSAFVNNNLVNNGLDGLMQPFEVDYEVLDTGELRITWNSQFPSVGGGADDSGNQSYEIYLGNYNNVASAQAATATQQITNIGNIWRITIPLASGTEVAFKVVGYSEDVYPSSSHTPYLISRIATASNVIVPVDEVFPLFVGYDSFAESGFLGNNPSARPILAASPTYRELFNDPTNWRFTYFSQQQGGSEQSIVLPKADASTDAQDAYVWNDNTVLPLTADAGVFSYRLEATNNNGTSGSSTEQLRREPIFASGGLNEIRVSLGESILEFTTSTTYTSQVTPIVISIYIDPKAVSPQIQTYETYQATRFTYTPASPLDFVFTQTFQNGGTTPTNISTGTGYFVKAVAETQLFGDNFYNVSVLAEATPLTSAQVANINLDTEAEVYFDAPGYASGTNPNLLVDIGSVSGSPVPNYRLSISHLRLRNGEASCTYLSIVACVGSGNFASKTGITGAQPLVYESASSTLVVPSSSTGVVSVIPTLLDSGSPLANGQEGFMQAFPISVSYSGSQVYAQVEWPQQFDESETVDYEIFFGTDRSKVLDATSSRASYGNQGYTSGASLSYGVPTERGIPYYIKVVASTELFPTNPIAGSRVAYLHSEILQTTSDPLNLAEDLSTGSDAASPTALFVGYNNFTESSFSGSVRGRTYTYPYYDLLQAINPSSPPSLTIFSGNYLPENCDFVAPSATCGSGALTVTAGANTQISTNIPSILTTAASYFVANIVDSSTNPSTNYPSNPEELYRNHMHTTAGSGRISLQIKPNFGYFTTHASFVYPSLQPDPNLDYSSPSTYQVFVSQTLAGLDSATAATQFVALDFDGTLDIQGLTNGTGYFAKFVALNQYDGQNFYRLSPAVLATPQAITDWATPTDNLAEEGGGTPSEDSSNPTAVADIYFELPAQSVNSTLVVNPSISATANLQRYVVALATEPFTLQPDGISCSLNESLTLIDCPDVSNPSYIELPGDDPIFIGHSVDKLGFDSATNTMLDTYFTIIPVTSSGTQSNSPSFQVPYFPLDIEFLGDTARLSWPAQFDGDGSEIYSYNISTSLSDILGATGAGTASVASPTPLGNSLSVVTGTLTESSTYFVRVVSSNNINLVDSSSQRLYALSTIVRFVFTSVVQPSIDSASLSQRTNGDYFSEIGWNTGLLTTAAASQANADGVEYFLLESNYYWDSENASLPGLLGEGDYRVPSNSSFLRNPAKQLNYTPTFGATTFNLTGSETFGLGSDDPWTEDESRCYTIVALQGNIRVAFSDEVCVNGPVAPPIINFASYSNTPSFPSGANINTIGLIRYSGQQKAGVEYELHWHELPRTPVGGVNTNCIYANSGVPTGCGILNLSTDTAGNTLSNPQSFASANSGEIQLIPNSDAEYIYFNILAKYGNTVSIDPSRERALINKKLDVSAGQTGASNQNQVVVEWDIPAGNTSTTENLLITSEAMSGNPAFQSCSYPQTATGGNPSAFCRGVYYREGVSSPHSLTSTFTNPASYYVYLITYDASYGTPNYPAFSLEEDTASFRQGAPGRATLTAQSPRYIEAPLTWTQPLGIDESSSSDSYLLYRSTQPLSECDYTISGNTCDNFASVAIPANQSPSRAATDHIYDLSKGLPASWSGQSLEDARTTPATYYYTLIGVNNSGRGLPSNEAQVLFQPIPFAEHATSIVSASSTQITLNMRVLPDDYDANFTYEVLDLTNAASPGVCLDNFYSYPADGQNAAACPTTPIGQLTDSLSQITFGSSVIAYVIRVTTDTGEEIFQGPFQFKRGKIRAFDHGPHHGCLADGFSLVYCWGYNQYGEVGYSALANPVARSPLQIASQSALPAEEAILDLALGYGFSCALYENSEIYCWGSDQFSTLGGYRTDTGDDKTPIPQMINNRIGLPPNQLLVNNPGSSVEDFITIHKLVASDRSVCAVVTRKYNFDLTTNNALGKEVMCWGSNQNGLLGRDETRDELGASTFATPLVFSGGEAWSEFSDVIDLKLSKIQDYKFQEDITGGNIINQQSGVVVLQDADSVTAGATEHISYIWGFDYTEGCNLNCAQNSVSLAKQMPALEKLPGLSSDENYHYTGSLTDCQVSASTPTWCDNSATQFNFSKPLSVSMGHLFGCAVVDSRQDRTQFRVNSIPPNPTNPNSGLLSQTNAASSAITTIGNYASTSGQSLRCWGLNRYEYFASSRAVGSYHYSFIPKLGNYTTNDALNLEGVANFRINQQQYLAGVPLFDRATTITDDREYQQPSSSVAALGPQLNRGDRYYHHMYEVWETRNFGVPWATDIRPEQRFNNFGIPITHPPTPRVSETSNSISYSGRFPVYTIPGISKVSSGLGHSCALTTDKRAFCWGLNHANQISNYYSFEYIRNSENVRTQDGTRISVNLDAIGNNQALSIPATSLLYFETGEFLPAFDNAGSNQARHELGNDISMVNFPIPLTKSSSTQDLEAYTDIDDILVFGNDTCIIRANFEELWCIGDHYSRNDTSQTGSVRATWRNNNSLFTNDEWHKIVY